jgi:hypothetical protein
MRKKLELLLRVATLVPRNANEDMVASLVESGGVCDWQESVGRFCVSAFGRNLASVAVKMFSHLNYFIKTFNKYCTSNAFRKDNSAINCITVKHKKCSFRQL